MVIPHEQWQETLTSLINQYRLLDIQEKEAGAAKKRVRGEILKIMEERTIKTFQTKKFLARWGKALKIENKKRKNIPLWKIYQIKRQKKRDAP